MLGVVVSGMGGGYDVGAEVERGGERADWDAGETGWWRRGDGLPGEFATEECGESAWHGWGDALLLARWVVRCRWVRCCAGRSGEGTNDVRDCINC